MAYGDSDVPTAPDYYRAGLLASALVYLGIVLLITISVAVENGDPRQALSAFFFGGLFMAFPAVMIAFLLAAPLGSLFGIAMREWLPPGRWHGAVIGVLTALSLIAAWVLLFDGEWREVPDAGTLIFVSGILAIAAASGWIAQRKVLSWPKAN